MHEAARVEERRHTRPYVLRHVRFLLDVHNQRDAIVANDAVYLQLIRSRS